MARAAIGLDVGTHAVHVVEVTTKRGQPTITNFGGVALPEGAVQQGEIVDVDTVSAAVRQLYKDAGIREKAVHLGISNQRVVVRQVDLPFMEDEELASALRFQVQEYIPIPVEDAELDYQKLEEVTGEGDTRMLRILLVAADKEMVANHVDIANRAELRPTGVDLNAFALLRALVPDPEAVEGSELLVDVGAGVTNIVVHENGTPRFVRILVLGGGDVTQAIQSRESLPYEDADQLKIDAGLRGAEDEEVGRTIRREVDQFVDEVRGSVDYYLAQPGSQEISRVLVSGGGSRLEGLVEELERTIRIPVERGGVFDHLPVSGSVYGPDQLAGVEPMLTTAVGLALGGIGE
ncbi:MAG: type IV pilus assembly protein PilM [Nitriliruptorales bacterium]